jgi:hypothetical protein
MMPDKGFELQKYEKVKKLYEEFNTAGHKLRMNPQEKELFGRISDYYEKYKGDYARSIEATKPQISRKNTDKKMNESEGDERRLPEGPVSEDLIFDYESQELRKLPRYIGASVTEKRPATAKAAENLQPADKNFAYDKETGSLTRRSPDGSPITDTGSPILNTVLSKTQKAGQTVANLVRGDGLGVEYKYKNWIRQYEKRADVKSKKRAQALKEVILLREGARSGKIDPYQAYKGIKLLEETELTYSNVAKEYMNDMGSVMTYYGALEKDKTSAMVTSIGADIGTGLAEIILLGNVLRGAGIMQKLGTNATSGLFAINSILRGAPEVASGEMNVREYATEIAGSVAMGQLIKYVQAGKMELAKKLISKTWAKKPPLQTVSVEGVLSTSELPPQLKDIGGKIALATEAAGTAGVGVGATGIKILEQAASGKKLDLEQAVTSGGVMALYQLMGAGQRYKATKNWVQNINESVNLKINNLMGINPYTGKPYPEAIPTPKERDVLHKYYRIYEINKQAGDKMVAKKINSLMSKSEKTILRGAYQRGLLSIMHDDGSGKRGYYLDSHGKLTLEESEVLNKFYDKAHDVSTEADRSFRVKTNKSMTVEELEIIKKYEERAYRKVLPDPDKNQFKFWGKGEVPVYDERDEVKQPYENKPKPAPSKEPVDETFSTPKQPEKMPDNGNDFSKQEVVVKNMMNVQGALENKKGIQIIAKEIDKLESLATTETDKAAVQILKTSKDSAEKALAEKLAKKKSWAEMDKKEQVAERYKALMADEQLWDSGIELLINYGEGNITRTPKALKKAHENKSGEEIVEYIKELYKAGDIDDSVLEKINSIQSEYEEKLSGIAPEAIKEYKKEKPGNIEAVDKEDKDIDSDLKDFLNAVDMEVSPDKKETVEKPVNKPEDKIIPVEKKGDIILESQPDFRLIERDGIRILVLNSSGEERLETTYNKLLRNDKSGKMRITDNRLRNMVFLSKDELKDLKKNLDVEIPKDLILESALNNLNYKVSKIIEGVPIFYSLRHKAVQGFEALYSLYYYEKSASDPDKGNWVLMNNMTEESKINDNISLYMDLPPDVKKSYIDSKITGKSPSVIAPKPKNESVEMDYQKASPEKARKAGFWYDSGRKVERTQKINNKIEGNEITLSYKDNPPDSQKGIMTIIEAEDLIVSHENRRRNPKHFVPEAQPNERVDEASWAALSNIKNNLDPERITDKTTTAFSGMPQTNERGETIQGNNRALAIKTVYAENSENAEKYRQYLIDNAKRWGMDSGKIKSFKNPVLVSMSAINDNRHIVLGNYDARDLESGSADENIKPIKIVRKVGKEFDGLLKVILKGQTENDLSLRDTLTRNTNKILDYMLKKGYINQTQYGNSINPRNGTLTPAAKDNLIEIIKHQLFVDTPANFNQNFIHLPQRVQDALLQNIPSIGNIEEADAILREVQESVYGYSAFLESNSDNFGDWISSTYFDAEGNIHKPWQEYSEIATKLMEDYKKSNSSGWKKQFDMKLQRYRDLAVGIPEFDSNGQANLFSEKGIGKAAAAKEVFGIKLQEEDFVDDDLADFLNNIDQEVENVPSITKDLAGDRENEAVNAMGGKDVSPEPIGSGQDNGQLGEKAEQTPKPTSDQGIHAGSPPAAGSTGNKPIYRPDGTLRPPRSSARSPKRRRSSSLDDKRIHADRQKQGSPAEAAEGIGDKVEQGFAELDNLFAKKPSAAKKTQAVDFEHKITSQDIDPELYKKVDPVLKNMYEETLAAGKKPSELVENILKRYGDDIRPYIRQFNENIRTKKTVLDMNWIRAEQKRKAEAKEAMEKKLNDERKNREEHDDLEFNERKSLQKDFINSGGNIKFNDVDNIGKSVPLLLAGQRKDVAKAEKRFYGDNPAKGILFTNGTGTGKTFVGLGEIFRHWHSGKKDILIVSPAGVRADWIESGKLFDLNINELKDTKDKGSGITVTSYSNMRSNNAILSREFDLIILDESHNILSNEKGTDTAGLIQIKKIARVASAAIEIARNELNFWEKERQIDKLQDKDKKNEMLNNLDEQVMTRAREMNKKGKVMMLSATPFSYHNNLKLADGLLWEIAETLDPDKIKRRNESMGAYNSPGVWEKFLIENLGYRMRYNKLTIPEAAVNVNLLERNFHQTMTEKGVFSRQNLELENVDYSREFIVMDDKVGNLLDEGYSLFEDYENMDKYKHLKKVLRDARWFRWIDKVQLLESLKARQAVQRIKKHLELGRKVIVFHTYVTSEPRHPFDFSRFKSGAPDVLADITSFEIEHSEIANLDLHGLVDPGSIISSVPDLNVGVYNGRVSSDGKRELIRRFNSSEPKDNIDVLVVQMEAGREGISLHDVIGNTPRAAIFIGLPFRPMAMVQLEGRGYRYGTKSNVIYEYCILGLKFERNVFGEKINKRVSTVENFAMGNDARDLEDQIREGVANPVYRDPNANQGTGGKELDAHAEVISPFEKAKTYYWQRMKKTQKNKSAEGIDYYATPEPLGYKIVQWLDAKDGDFLIEPSAGHGAIARFFGANTSNVFVEPSGQLRSILQVIAKGRVINEEFEDLSTINKANGIAMNPPFGKGGKLAMEHLRKAVRHLSYGGRIIAILPDNTRVENELNELLAIEKEKAVNDMYLVADIKLPAVTFERAGTKIKTRLIVIDRHLKSEYALDNPVNIDVQADNINDFFDNIENINLPVRNHDIDNLKNEALEKNKVLKDFSNKEFNHTGTGERIFVAQFERYFGRDSYLKLKKIAEMNDGYYSKWNKNGIKPGFHFKSKDNRDAFLSEAGKEIQNQAQHDISIERIKDEIDQFEDEISRAIDEHEKLILKTKKEIKEQILREIKNGGQTVSKTVFNPVTDSGKKLYQNILQDVDGKKFGVRSIVDFINKQLNIQLLERGSEQVSQKSPANFRPSSGFIRAREANSQAMFHEQGHYIWEYIIKRDPNALQNARERIKAVAELSGSMASDYNVHEGFAEYIRRYITNPDSIPTELNAFLHSAVQGYLLNANRNIYDTLLDARAAFSAHLSRSALAQFRSYSKDKPKLPNTLEEIKDKIGWVAFAIARGYGIERFDRKIIREILKSADSRKIGISQARNWREEIIKNSDPIASYQNIVRIPAEINDIFDGTKHGKNGVKVIGDDGNYIYLSDKSFKDIYDEVGNARWELFEVYSWAKVSKARYDKKGVNYPGQLDGISPDILEQMVVSIEEEVSDFPDIFKDFEGYYDALLDVSVLSGERTKDEAIRMKDYYEHYAPLLRIMPNGARGHIETRVSPGSNIKNVRGGNFQGYRSLVSVAEQRTEDVISGYYWNKLIVDLIHARDASQELDIPIEAKELAYKMISPLKMDTKIMAKLSEAEQKRMVADWINRERGFEEHLKQVEQEKGEKIDPELYLLNPEIIESGRWVTAKDIVLSFGHKPIFRKVKPNAVYVLAPWVKGKRMYIQINDPIMFAVFCQSRDPATFLKWMDKVFNPVVQAWKKPLTSNIVFAIWNSVFRDPFNAVFMGDSKGSLIPGYYAAKGLANRISNKYPQVQKMDELFSRVLEHTSSNEQKLRNSRFTQKLLAGIWHDNWDNWDVWEKAASIPGKMMHTILKPVEIMLWLTQQEWLAQVTEELGREGRSVEEIEKNGSDSRVNMMYDHITGNFGEHSGFSDLRYFLRQLGFVNAGLQIEYRQILKATDPIEGKKAMFRLAWAGIVVPAILWALKEIIGTKEDDQREKMRPEEDRFAYMDIKGIRAPFEYGAIGAFQSFTWNMLDKYVAEKKWENREKFARAIMQRIIDIPAPNAMITPVLKAFLEAKVNKNFYFDKDIEPWWMGSLPIEERRYATTPQIYTKISGFTKMSPLKLQHIVASGFNRQIDQTLALGDRFKNGTLSKEYLENNHADIPYIGRLFIRKPLGWGSAPVQGLADEIKKKKMLLEDMAKDIDMEKDEDTPEYEAFLLQLHTCQILDAGMKEIDKAQKIIREEQKKPRPDWSIIEELKAYMTKIATEIMLQTKIMESK